MENSRHIALISHCLLNPNSKIKGSGHSLQKFIPLIDYLLSADIAIYQLPCPEQSYLGCNRWGQSREQYDNPYYRNHCRTLSEPVIRDMLEYKNNGYSILFLLGIKGSPSCGIAHTYSAAWSGEISAPITTGRFIKDKGIYMEQVAGMLEKSNLDIPLVEVDEADIQGTINRLTEFNRI